MRLKKLVGLYLTEDPEKPETPRYSFYSSKRESWWVGTDVLDVGDKNSYGFEDEGELMLAPKILGRW